MNILQIASGNFFSTYGGGQVYVKNIVDELLRQQRDVSVVSFIERPGGIERRDYNGCDLYEVGKEGERQLERLVKEVRPDVIHAHSHKAEACRIGRQSGIPVVVTAHHGGILCPAGALLDCDDRICFRKVSHRSCLKCVLRNTRWGLGFYPFMRLLPEQAYIHFGHWLSRKPFVLFVTPVGEAAACIEGKQRYWEEVVRYSTRVIAPSGAVRRAMELNGLPSGKCVLLRHGIPMPSAEAAMPAFTGGIKFFYVGRICYVKGIHVLLKAFHALPLQQVELHIVGGAGNKGEQRYMYKLQQQYAADSRIVWHGKVAPTEVFDRMKECHVSVAPSIYMEIFGLNIAESLAMGKPVLATRCGGAEMQIEDGVNGWLVEPDDADALNRRMQQLVARPECIVHAAARCRQTVTDIGTHCKALWDIYSENKIL